MSLEYPHDASAQRQVGALSYHGQADLVLTYGEAPGLSRTAERLGVELGVSRQAPGQPAMILVGQELRLDLAKGPTSARLQLPDGTLIEGRVDQSDGYGDAFLIHQGVRS